MRNLARTILIACGLVGMLAQSSPAVTYTGSLSTAGGGLTGTGIWGTSPSTLIEWTVSDGSGSNWLYAYNLTMPSKDISHFIIEASPSFTSANIWDVSSSTSLKSVEVGTFGEKGKSTPGIPSLIYGIKFDVKGDTTDIEVSFMSDRSPVWGDFYAKDGKQKSPKTNVAIWNTGFTSLDSDPLAPAASGALSNHLLVPDTNGGGGDGDNVYVIPEPLTILAIGMSLAAAGAAARKSVRGGI